MLASAPMLAAHGAFDGTYLAVLAVQFLTTFFLRESLGASAGVIGATMLAYPATTAVMGPVSATPTTSSTPASATGSLDP